MVFEDMACRPVPVSEVVTGLDPGSYFRRSALMRVSRPWASSRVGTSSLQTTAPCQPDRNPYRRWFDPLDQALRAAFGVSYYAGTACHLDLVQWATTPVWNNRDRRKGSSSVPPSARDHSANAGPASHGRACPPAGLKSAFLNQARSDCRDPSLALAERISARVYGVIAEDEVVIVRNG
jgi:hypothetical protein